MSFLVRSFFRSFQFGVFWLVVVVGGVRSMSLFVVLLTGVSSVSLTVPYNYWSEPNMPVTNV